jgi:hypothetical protein
VEGPREISADKISAVLLAMLRDIRTINTRYRNADLDRDIETVSRRVNAQGVKFATLHLPRFFDGLVGYLETGKSVYPGFKKLGRQQYPHFLRGLVAPIYAHPTSGIAVENMKQVYQFCMAFKKIQGPADQKLLRSQLADFVDVDIELNSLDISLEPVRDIARHAKEIIGDVMKGLDPHDPDQSQLFIPRPGPGATNTATKHAHRFRPMRWYTDLFDVFEPSNWFQPPYSPRTTWPRYWQKQLPTGLTRIGRRRVRSVIRKTTPGHIPTSRFKFVPKTFEKMRGICIEENELQWFQQAIRRAMYKRIEAHPVTKGFVNFSSQLVNRALALDGSRNQDWATIDMSSASDRISLKLVRYLFSMNKPLLAAIEACSSRWDELPKGTEDYFIRYLPLNKIAPMGSAICFPIMSLVHYALIRAILYRASVARDKSRNVYVYGDDIIVDRSCVQAIYDYLPLFGMKINTDKSFSNSLFRESCGCHAYNGVDITPTRFKNLLTIESSPADLATALRLEEAFYYKGYKQTAGLLRHDIQEVALKYGIKHVPLVNTKSQLFGFYRNDCDAKLSEFITHAKRRWVVGDEDSQLSRNRPFSQTWVYEKVAVIADTFDESSSFLCEEDRYLRYLTLGGQWASKKYDEGFSRNTIFRKIELVESSLGYRC